MHSLEIRRYISSVSAEILVSTQTLRNWLLRSWDIAFGCSLNFVTFGRLCSNDTCALTSGMFSSATGFTDPILKCENCCCCKAGIPVRSAFSFINVSLCVCGIQHKLIARKNTEDQDRSTENAGPSHPSSQLFNWRKTSSHQRLHFIPSQSETRTMICALESGNTFKVATGHKAKASMAQRVSQTASRPMSEKPDFLQNQRFYLVFYASLSCYEMLGFFICGQFYTRKHIPLSACLSLCNSIHSRSFKQNPDLQF